MTMLSWIGSSVGNWICILERCRTNENSVDVITAWWNCETQKQVYSWAAKFENRLECLEDALRAGLGRIVNNFEGRVRNNDDWYSGSLHYLYRESTETESGFSRDKISNSCDNVGYNVCFNLILFNANFKMQWKCFNKNEELLNQLGNVWIGNSLT
jgi:hypothetical protein